MSYRKVENARKHERVVHIDDDALDEARKDADHGMRLPEELVEERWIVIYDDVGTIWEHPKQVEGKKRRILRALEDADYYPDLGEMLERVRLPDETFEHPARDQMKRDELRELLDELVDEDRVEREGRNWGVSGAEKTAEITTARQ